ncbi:General substrate transporter [Macleaya cordata]|uniref:General substrate transporter n=1 Tax=Macleaya cordata TaxID=56857 RepID=A0A200PR14_MACCD|nr:General substrate transporter [Macleaya cordata]
MGLKVLSALDSAKTQYYHFKAIIIAGMGLFTDAYDLFCIPPVMKLIGRIYYDDHDEDDQYNNESHGRGIVPPSVVSISVAIALLGTVFGNVVFGRLADKVGRKRVYGFALLLMIFSSIGCGFSICRTRKCVMTSLCFFRFLLGVGIGGDYPISATIMSEFANKTTRGSFIAAVFSMQGFGILTSSAVTMMFCAVFERASKSKTPDNTPDEADLVWRLILMFGAVPATMTYYWRMTMPETARYTALVEQNLRQAVMDMEKVLDVPMHQITGEFDVVPTPTSYGIISKEFFRRHGQDLFACASAWFLVDVVFYSSNLFQSHIYGDILRKPHNEKLNAYQEAFDVAKLQAIVAICSTIPGYWATVFFIDRIGRVKIQIIGFLGMAICLFAIGIPYYQYWDNHTNAWFLILYGLTFFFSNFGPNTTTFIVPAELFPARLRSTCHGISGAAGKIGAIIGSVGFLWASQSKNKSEVGKGYHKGIGMTSVLVILGGICVLGMILTYLFTRETKGRSLEENEIDDQDNQTNFLRCFTCCKQNDNGDDHHHHHHQRSTIIHPSTSTSTSTTLAIA